MLRSVPEQEIASPQFRHEMDSASNNGYMSFYYGVGPDENPHRGGFQHMADAWEWGYDQAKENPTDAG